MKKLKDAKYKLERALLKLNGKYEFWKNDRELFKELDKALAELTNQIENLEWRT